MCRIGAPSDTKTVPQSAFGIKYFKNLLLLDIKLNRSIVIA